MRVAEAMTHGYQRVKAADSIRSAAELMRYHNIGMLLVEDTEGEIRGTITDRDITTRALAEGATSDSPVERYMSADLISCHSDDGLYDAVELMEREQVRRLLVRGADERPVGVLTQGDVAIAIGTYGVAGELVEEVSQPSGKHSQH